MRRRRVGSVSRWAAGWWSLGIGGSCWGLCSGSLGTGLVRCWTGMCWQAVLARGCWWI